MQVRRKIKTDKSAKKKLPKLLIIQGFRCLECGCKMVRVAAVKKYRTLAKNDPGKFVRWVMPCGDKIRRPVATVDHIIPRWNGGTNRIENLQALCSTCNSKKHVEETKHFRTRFNGTCRKCGKQAPKNETKCYECCRGEFEMIKIPEEKDKPNPYCYKRKVHINGEEWSWKPAKDRVLISNPDGVKWNVRLDILLGISFEAIEKARHKRTNDANVTPSIVKDYIEKVILGNNK